MTRGSRLKPWRYTGIGINRQNMANSDDNPLGCYLKDRRAKLDPAAFGFSSNRRRTPGLRREEVARRADVSVTWYTWLEQGRGGTPSADVLDRIADALTLAAVEREHLFLIAQNRPPRVQYQAPESVSPRLQRVLDSLKLSPAFVKTATWDVIAWNRAATAVLGDYAALPPERRNCLRNLFCNPRVRAEMVDWENNARSVVAVFRADVARAGASESVGAMVDELSRSSPEFEAMWRDHAVRNFGEGTKHLHHSTAGPIKVEYSAFAVDGRPDLSLVIFTPATPMDEDRIRSLVEGRT